MKKHSGFTLIELMVSLGIGLFLIAGIFTVYINSNKSQKFVEDEVKLIDDARFALETISYDLKHAGIYGTLNHESYDKVSEVSRNLFAANPAGQCDQGTGGWVTRVDQPVFSTNDMNPYSADCIPAAAKYSAGDVFEVRYVSRIDNAAPLFDDVIYMSSDSNNAQFFLGDNPPTTVSPQSRNYQVVVRAYYLSSYTDTIGDGIPSLHMVSLQPGPSIKDTLLLEGVSDMQLQFGLAATNKGTSVVTWQHPEADMDWSRVIAARIWLVMQSREKVRDVDTSTEFEVAGVIQSYPNDGYRRTMVTTAVRLRNMNTGGG